MSHFRTRLGRYTAIAIDRFTDWFTSAGAFAQGTIITIVWLAAVFSGAADKHGWWLLFAFTVFSGVTQFPLAYAARRAAEASDRALTEIDKALDILESQDNTQADMLRAVISLLDTTAATGTRMEDMIGELRANTLSVARVISKIEQESLERHGRQRQRIEENSERITTLIRELGVWRLELKEELDQIDELLAHRDTPPGPSDSTVR